MKNLFLIFAVVVVIFVVSSNANGQICSSSIAYTSCFPWLSGDNTLPNGKPNDTPRLNRAIAATLGKLIFNEAEYYINDSLNLFSYRIIEGTGRSSFVGTPLHTSSKIIQTVSSKSIFKIGINITDVSIRDIALVAGTGTTGTIGILAEGNCVVNCSSISFQFSNIKFSGLDKGIYVNATDAGHNWQFDNVRIDQSSFENCNIGIHINSYNSGWNMSSLEFLMPKGDPLPPIPSPPTPHGVNTYGIYLERSTYTSMNLLIGNGESSTDTTKFATALVYVKQHGNLTIQNAVAEGFWEDVNINGSSGTGRNSPINLMNNAFLNGVRIKDSTVFSTGNQFGFGSFVVPAIAEGTAQIYSIGDKFCVEGTSGCDEGRGYETQGEARVIFSSNQGRNRTDVPSFIKDRVEIKRDNYEGVPILTVISPNYPGNSLLRIGRADFYFDVTRSEVAEDAGYLRFTGNQPGYGGYTFKTQGGTVKINYDGSVTYGSKGFSTLGSSDSGTMVYCTDCQQTNPCSSGGSGAMAKRIAGSWVCN